MCYIDTHGCRSLLRWRLPWLRCVRLGLRRCGWLLGGCLGCRSLLRSWSFLQGEHVNARQTTNILNATYLSGRLLGSGGLLRRGGLRGLWCFGCRRCCRGRAFLHELDGTGGTLWLIEVAALDATGNGGVDARGDLSFGAIKFVVCDNVFLDCLSAVDDGQ